MITYPDVLKLRDEVGIELKKRFPMFQSVISTLGGEDKAAIMVTFSLDHKSTWPNGYIENARYYRISIDHTPTMFEVENFVCVRGFKMRSFKISESTKVIEKLNQFYDKIIKELGIKSEIV